MKKPKKMDLINLLDNWWLILNEWRCPFKRELYKEAWTKDHVRGAMEILTNLRSKIVPVRGGKKR